ncbi:L-proline dehydrogenase [Filimonas lacunae]|uniref:L-proline dehydrogenase n=1 Tax=Filimonas lacunae TaxID=477680 RepID=A0A173MLG6_9BACT|nr:proline dehydrogenase family protein [Filimonas lacunae]BAV08309.1 carbapenem antibiotics biosynthesis protein CarD [Filimonas lacunae]SIT33321.1 L-proline dehydrogenase [Filimonas lacunae]
MHEQLTRISFSNTKQGFIHKTDKQLKNAHQLFNMMNYPLLVKAGTIITPLLLKWKFPINGLIEKTIFAQFVGGKSLPDTAPVINNLKQHNVAVILDYGAEGRENEESFEAATSEFLRIIEYASGNNSIPFISVKLTAIARFALLEKCNSLVTPDNCTLNTSSLTTAEAAEWQAVMQRLHRIAQQAALHQTSVLIDAEESWIQDTIDAATTELMRMYNLETAVVYNTIQLYRKRGYTFLKQSHELAQADGYILAVKLVRGAYMEKERKRASELNYSSPIQDTKEDTDKAFNQAVAYCIDFHQSIHTIVASHNEHSNLMAVRLMENKSTNNESLPVHFSQLYGMSDNITYNLAKGGFSVSKYLPYGAIADVIPYLMRRAQENSSVAGQTGRELSLIKKEIQRRSLSKKAGIE